MKSRSLNEPSPERGSRRIGAEKRLLTSGVTAAVQCNMRIRGRYVVLPCDDRTLDGPTSCRGTDELSWESIHAR
jgi:hypothetical protein